MDRDKLVIHMAKIKTGEHVGKLAGREKGEEEAVWLYEGNTDSGITADEDLQDLFMCVCVCIM